MARTVLSLAGLALVALAAVLVLAHPAAAEEKKTLGGNVNERDFMLAVFVGGIPGVISLGAAVFCQHL
ncbi:uncharacterized protein AMSG_05253 [Thecamonas trahens ATCC 50062]|uniref:Uncharacterized protein n=1 Tax=Thecamonas trahens ATCC 50062 TaxID=461836 RepID=A0A0L0DD56_THETB|nr:hypothetical protein AMSG_05253 [Thecamonas trahens ATCC 50062]KNC49258.1 hypothetical protein AMSG_05253 [Thecamonas trahens ATCC 50062]|eukprot:XP_013757972.1 hypothetical protein AMSG_05253 [Thecamonas trahens ATCC 50062]